MLNPIEVAIQSKGSMHALAAALGVKPPTVAKTQLANLPPEQWVFAMQTFYNGLKQAGGPVQQKVPPLRNGLSAAQTAEPQNMQEAMFGGL